jgi:UDP-glucose 4-epimerase
MMRVLVTGGAGFIGSHLVERLVSDGHKVTVFDDLSAWHSWNNLKDIKGITLKKVNMAEYFQLPDADVIYHLAADSIIPTETLELYRRNILSMINLLLEMERQSIKNLVYASGGIVYGDMSRPKDEWKPMSLYGASKLACEQLITAFKSHYDFNSWIYRFGNVVGSRMDHAVIHDFLKQIKEFGEIRMHGDGSQRRSFIHVDDVVEALATTMGRNYGTFDLCSNDTLNVNEIIEIIKECLGKNIPVKQLTRWNWDVKLCYPDNTALKATGWKPTMSSRQAVKKATEELMKEILD